MIFFGQPKNRGCRPLYPRFWAPKRAILWCIFSFLSCRVCANMGAPASRHRAMLPQMWEVLPVTVRYFRKCWKHFLSSCGTSANVGSTSRRRAMLPRMWESTLHSRDKLPQMWEAYPIAATSYLRIEKVPHINARYFFHHRACIGRSDRALAYKKRQSAAADIQIVAAAPLLIM